MKISVVWWNTSFSPPKAKPGRITKEDKDVFTDLLIDLTSVKKIEILGFCELSQANANWLESFCAPFGYKMISGIIKAGKSTFDTCLIYRHDVLEFIDHLQHTEMELRRTKKIGLQYLFKITGENLPLHLFTLHWPSRIYLNGWDPNRISLGKSLRKPIQAIIDQSEKCNENALIVVMGDFNDEPFDAPLTDGLYATRDRALIAKNPHLLYNPFWRRLGGRDGYSHSTADNNYSGTYYYTSSPTDRWRTFDQIIVSSAFVGKSNWHLIESETEIIDYAPYTKRVLDTKSKFDHLPIKISIERV